MNRIFNENDHSRFTCAKYLLFRHSNWHANNERMAKISSLFCIIIYKIVGAHNLLVWLGYNLAGNEYLKQQNIIKSKVAVISTGFLKLDTLN